MATDTTFNTLQTDVRRYIERGFSDTTDPIVYDQIPRLINLAERIIAKELKVEGQKVPMTFNMVAGQSVYAKPDRWRLTASMWIGTNGATSSPSTGNTRVPLFPRSYEYCRNYWPDATVSAAANPPAFYADYDSQTLMNWLIAPTPAAAFAAEVTIYQMPPLLDNATQQNWLTAYAPQLLLFGTMLQCAPFLKSDERIQTWQTMYDRALASFMAEDVQKITDNTTDRTRA